MSTSNSITPAITAQGLNEVAKSMMEWLNDSLTENRSTGAPFNPYQFGLVCGSAVLSGLSIELSLKALVEKHTGQLPHGHNHVTLFSKVPESIRENAAIRYEELRKKYNARNISQLEGNLEAILNLTKDCFVSWRYIHEPKSSKVSFPYSAANLAAIALIVEANAT